MDAQTLDRAFAGGEFHRLLRGPAEAPADYVREVSEAKRVLEWRDVNPEVRQALSVDPAAALKRIGVSLRPDDVRALVDPTAAPTLIAAVARGAAGGDLRVAARHYAYCLEMMAETERIRREGRPRHAGLAAWRARQMARASFEMSAPVADFLIHAPMAFELSQGCSVGCWFCGVDALRLEATWPCTEENRALFRAALEAVRGLVGEGAKYGFCYWATDPFDNPDYEHFVEEFQRVLGYCPHTTTALPTRDLGRTRKFLEMARRLDSMYDNFSILTVKAFEQVQSAFGAEEMLRVMCLPKNREAANPKFYAGRARKHAKRRPAEVMPAERAGTICCVSGFLFNMLEGTVKLITPCRSSDRWPLGYRVVDEGRFTAPGEIRPLLQAIVDRSVVASLPADRRVRLHPEASVTVADDCLVIRSAATGARFGPTPAAAALAEFLASGEFSAREIAGRLEPAPRSATLALLSSLFEQGMLDEEP